MNTISPSLVGKPIVAGSASCEPRSDLSATTRKKPPLIASLILTIGVLLLGGCAGSITGVSLAPASRTVCDPTGAVCGVSDSESATFQVSGQGKCGTIGINYGDGAQENANGNFYMFTPSLIYFMHDYTTQHPQGPRAWPGRKTVHAYSVANCVGEARMQLNVLLQETDATGQVVFLPAFRVAIMPPTVMACNVAPNARPIRKGSTVSITEVPGGPMINFGCPFNGCTNDTAGNSGATHPGFPFPALRRHSLVLRIVSASGETQVEQGQPITRFVARVDGPLEFCLNDTVLSDNSGAWVLDVSVDETQAP